MTASGEQRSGDIEGSFQLGGGRAFSESKITVLVLSKIGECEGRAWHKNHNE